VGVDQSRQHRVTREVHNASVRGHTGKEFTLITDLANPVAFDENDLMIPICPPADVENSSSFYDHAGMLVGWLPCQASGNTQQ
jgi:hypothetical protein